MRQLVLAALVLCAAIGGPASGARAQDDEGWRSEDTNEGWRSEDGTEGWRSHDRPRGRDHGHHVVVDEDGRPAQSDAVVGRPLAPMRPYWGQMRPYWGPTQADRPMSHGSAGRGLK